MKFVADTSWANCSLRVERTKAAPNQRRTCRHILTCNGPIRRRRCITLRNREIGLQLKLVTLFDDHIFGLFATGKGST